MDIPGSFVQFCNRLVKISIFPSKALPRPAERIPVPRRKRGPLPTTGSLAHRISHEIGYYNAEDDVNRNQLKALPLGRKA